MTRSLSLITIDTLRIHSNIIRISEHYLEHSTYTKDRNQNRLGNYRTVRLAYIRHLSFAYDLQQEIFFHGNDLKQFHQYVSVDRLPADYGGNLPPIDYTGQDWYPCVEAQLDHISKYQQCGFVPSQQG